MMRLLLWVAFAALCVGWVIAAACICALHTDSDPALLVESIAVACAYGFAAAFFGIVIFEL